MNFFRFIHSPTPILTGTAVISASSVGETFIGMRLASRVLLLFGAGSKILPPPQYSKGRSSLRLTRTRSRWLFRVVVFVRKHARRYSVADNGTVRSSGV